MIQNLIVFVLIASAAFYVVFAFVNSIKRKKSISCGSCSACSEFEKTKPVKINPNKTSSN